MCLRKKKDIRFNDARSFKVNPEENLVKYPSNFIRTSKYTLGDFFPRTLLQQFYKYANIYFLMIGMIKYKSNFAEYPYNISFEPGYCDCASGFRFVCFYGSGRLRRPVETQTGHDSESEKGRKTSFHFEPARRGGMDQHYSGRYSAHQKRL
jgi:hypothetical protein